MAKEIKTEESVQVESAASKTEQFYSANKKVIWGVVGGVILVILLVLAYGRFIYQPKCAEAQGQAVAAEQAFAKGEYELALNGDGNALGFAQIIEDYGAKAGKAVYFYAGVCCLQAGNFEQAVSYLKKYSGKDTILKAKALSCLGDAYVGLGEDNYGKALDSYKAAVKCADNVFAATYLLKMGVVYEAQGNKAEALKCYNTIKEDYPMSMEAYEIDRYIAGVEAAEE